MQNCKGFSLIEVMTGFAVLILSILVFSPLLEFLYKERQTVQQHYLALAFLHDLLEKHVINASMEIETTETTLKNTTFYITSEGNSHIHKYCVEWVGANEREYKKCIQAK
ncbi:type IV pilus modification PilV family protein [Bacillus taeanensis]|uniref:type IV pilus modification PilV family protein n=1 Tax=Bacillus taeanensis TaxID=273032 RepID=UPI0015F0D24D|nr:type II secretion system protein [Bacillus taeanensis]